MRRPNTLEANSSKYKGGFQLTTEGNDEGFTEDGGICNGLHSVTGFTFKSDSH